jgi:deoxyribodipyrimidine photolyase-related protein
MITFAGSKEAAFVFPHQLFERHPSLAPGRLVFFLEEGDPSTCASAYRKACGKAWVETATSRGFEVRILPTRFAPSVLGNVNVLHAADPVDSTQEEWFLGFCRENGITPVLQETPAFLLDRSWLEGRFEGRRTFRMAEFYREVRRETGLLLDPRGKPLGGKWSFDPENRRKLPRGIPVPPAWGAKTAARLRLPLTRREALESLSDFLEHRFDGFGDYEDAMAMDETVLFHSVLSPALNVGLLTPAEVLGAALERHETRPVPLNSLEGFTRQVSGWREFMRAMYRQAGSRLRAGNALSHFAPLPKGFAAGETGMPPVDAVVARVNLHGYAHHIERLMVLGNFLLLCETDPRAVTGWFMSRFADATDWAMVPNVFGMSQFAGGGLMTTKPYCSSSSYLLRMGDFPRGAWCGDWDALFWRFVRRHRELFARNPRTAMLTRQLDRMSPSRLDALLARAESLLRKYHE